MNKLHRILSSFVFFLIVAGLWINFFEINLPIQEDKAVSAELEEPIITPSPTVTILTPIIGKSTHTLEQAKKWAKKKNATEKFISAADLYWSYGEKFGIRADVLYAQAGKETAYGRYTGNVSEDMNNFAGIKKAGAVGDEREKHESFKTVEDGVKAHFNHMAAYVGVKPIEPVHGRYKSVMSCDWAGTIKYVEQLSGKWAPAKNYGSSIVKDYLDKM